MVLAPKVGAVQGGKRRTLLDAPVLYGGGGGMDIFNDVWVYDAETQVWLPISPSAVVGYAPPLMSLTGQRFTFQVCIRLCFSFLEDCICILWTPQLQHFGKRSGSCTTIICCINEMLSMNDLDPECNETSTISGA